MTTCSGISRLVVAAVLIVAAVAMPLAWNRSGTSLNSEATAQTAESECHCCCCAADDSGSDGAETCCCTCCCGESDNPAADHSPCPDSCICGRPPDAPGQAGAFLLLGGIAPPAWKAPTAVEVISAPAAPVATACRILARWLPAPETAERLARTCVRTT